MNIETMMGDRTMPESAQRSEEFLQPKNEANLLLPVMSKLIKNNYLIIFLIKYVRNKNENKNWSML